MSRAGGCRIADADTEQTLTARELLAALADREISVWAEQDDLKVSAPTGALSSRDVDQLRSRKLELLVELRRAGRWGPRLSAQQERLWYLERIEPNLTAYVLPGAFRIDGPLRVEVLKEAVSDFLERHDLSGVHIVTDGGRPAMACRRSVPLAFRVIDAADVLEDPDDESELERWIEIQADVSIPSSEPPLVRFTLVRVAAAIHVLVLVAHHTVWDGWCFDLFLDEVGEFYAARLAGRAVELPTLSATYADFVRAQRGSISRENAAEGARFWSKVLDGSLPDLDLVGDRPRPPRMTYNGSRVPFSVASDELGGIRALGRAEHATVFLTLLAAYKVLLYRATRQQDLIVAVPVQGRQSTEFERVVGFFVDTVVVRTHPTPGLTFREFLRQVRDRFLAVLDNQNRFEWLVQKFGRRDLSRTPIFQTMFTHQFAAQRKEMWGDVHVQSFNAGARSVTTDISLWVREYDDRIDGGVDFRSDLFDIGSVAALVGAYHRILDAVIHDPDLLLDEIPLLDERGIVAETEGRSGPRREGAEEDSFLELIAKLSVTIPAAVALQDHRRSVTYAELWDGSGAVASVLQANGVTDGQAVALLVERDSRVPVLLLGILRAGAVYVPFDPTYPVDRLRFMAADSEARLAIVDDVTCDLAVEIGLEGLSLTTLLGGGPRAERRLPMPTAAAYRIYTSGSTGQPKAVEVSHGALNNFLIGTRDLLGLTSSDVLLAITTTSFDISLLELLLPLLAGGRVIVASSEETMDAAALAERIHTDAVSVMQATPATWRMLLDERWSGGLRVALCGGESFPRPLAEALCARCGQVWNMYGPTETTVWSTAHQVDAGSGRVPVGTPILNTRVYVLDDQGRPVPQGVPGEIWIGGAGVALGYWHRDVLTGERFRPDPFATGAGARMYRTGDLGRWRADGTLDHLGRVDLQVKVHGYRVELGEVEAALESLPAIREAAVDARGEDADRRLIAWVILDAGLSDPPTSSEMRRALRDRLPAFMVPAIVVPVDEIPLTLNGKVDRARLPDPTRGGGGIDRPEFAPPQGTLEEIIADEWRRLIPADRISRHDNFFELGGHSLLSLQVVAAVEQRTGQRIDPRRFFFSTLAQLAQ